MSILEIPVRADLPAYTFRIQLETVVYQFSFRFNTRMERWLMDIGDSNGNDILIGIPMLSNLNMHGRYRTEGLPPGQFLVYDETGQNRNPTREEFGKTIKLLYKESA